MITKAQAAQIEALLDDLLAAVGKDLVKRGGENYVKAVKEARRALTAATEGRHLPQQLKRARQLDMLPLCSHRSPLMDWSGEQLVPRCGCRLVEPTRNDTTPRWKEIIEGKPFKPAKTTKGARK